ncbi:MAG: DUF4136 domain-containing protein [Ferruginibacter sp.]
MLTRLLRNAVLAVAGMVFVSSCANTAHIEKTPGADLSKFKTYSWAPEDDTAQAKSRRKQILDERIHDAVDKQLQKNGLSKTDADPDVFISADVVVEKNAEERNNPVYSQPYGRTFFNRRNGRFYTYYFPSQFLGYDTYTTTTREGKVTVTLIDAKTDKAVWQGWASRELSDKHVSDKDIDKNVESIFKKFE